MHYTKDKFHTLYSIFSAYLKKKLLLFKILMKPLHTKDKFHALHCVYQGQIACTTSCIPRTNFMHYIQGRIKDFKLGGGALKKNCAERREARNLLRYFV